MDLFVETFLTLRNDFVQNLLELEGGDLRVLSEVWFLLGSQVGNFRIKYNNNKPFCYVSRDLNKETLEVRIHVVLHHVRLEGRTEQR